MVSEAEVDAALREERIRLHAQALTGSLAASGGIALVLAAALWPQAPHTKPLLLWLAGVLAALAMRKAVGLAQAHDASATRHAARWLWRHRAAYALHGLAWAALALVVQQAGGAQTLALAVFGLALMTAGAFSTAAFDLRAALLFSLAPMAAALACALRGPGTGVFVLALMALTLMTVAAHGGRRGHGLVRESVRLRLAAQHRADEAQVHNDRADAARHQLSEQHHLHTQLLQSTPQGFLFMDNTHHITDLNPAMVQLLGRPREDILGHKLTSFVTGDDLQTLQHELQQRTQGRSGHYELGLVRPDGSRVHCVCLATPLYDTAGAWLGSVGIWTDITARRRAELMLRGYELVVNSITDMVAVLDKDETYLLVNDAWCSSTGVARENALGRPSIEVLPRSISPQRRQALQDCVASGQVQVARGASATPGCEDRVLETTYFPRRGDSGAVQYVAVVTRDITDQEQRRAALVASEAEQRLLLDAFPGHISRLDEQGRYTYANRSLAALLGLQPEQMVGRPLAEVLGPARAAVLHPLVARALAGETLVYEHHHHPPNAVPAVNLQITMTAGIDPRTGARAVYGFAIDISARQRAEAALVAARDEAERANRAKSQFLSQMSHELRTPMNAIIGFGQLLGSDTRQPLAEHQQAWVREMLRGADHLLSLINEILDLGRIEAGELQLAPQALPLWALVDECLGLVRALAQTRGVRLYAPPAALQGVCVLADRRRLKQVLLNLLGNAIKYNRPAGEVAVEFRMEGQRVWLAVRDSGRGLTAGERARLFQPFERLSAAQSGVEGTGIGLALSRRLVEAMGGTIGVDSQPGTGSTFWVRMPNAPTVLTADDESSDAQAKALAAARHAAPLCNTVLYIEDNAVNVVLMEAMLARLPGLRVLSAPLPSEGLRLAAQEKPALILLDIQLPEMDGFEVLVHLRANPHTAGTPVLAVSANALPSDIDAALAAGFAGYITKPVVLDELLTTVQRMLQRG